MLNNSLPGDYPKRKLIISRSISNAQELYSSDQLEGNIGLHFYLVYARLANAYLDLREYDLAQQAYEASLTIVENLQAVTGEVKANYKAIVYHQLGIVAQAQRAWTQAEGHYQQALALKIEFNDRYSQASTYHQLGRVAEEQRAWAQAAAHYQQTLALKIEFNDRYSQASTYGQLGLLAEAQEDWIEAGKYLVQALQLFVEFQDQHSIEITINNLARLHRAGGDATLPAAVLGVDVATVDAQLSAGDEG